MFALQATYLAILVINVLPKPFHLNTGDVCYRCMQPPADRAVRRPDQIPLTAAEVVWPVILGRMLAVELPHLLKGMIFKPFLPIYTAIDVGLQDNGYLREALSVLCQKVLYPVMVNLLRFLASSSRCLSTTLQLHILFIPAGKSCTLKTSLNIKTMLTTSCSPHHFPQASGTEH